MNAVLAVLRALDLVIAVTGALPQIAALRAKAEGRDPTPKEWNDLFGDIDADSARLDAGDKRLNG
jgi:hypothetical protein